MDLITLINLLLSAAILVLGIKRYLNTGVKAFIAVGLGFLLFGISHAAKLAGLEVDYTTVVSVIRIGGYLLVMTGMLL